MTRIVLLSLMLLFGHVIIAQSTVFEEKRTIYKSEQAFGGVIHTRGWGVTYRSGKYTSGFTRRIYEVELVGMKHPKEIKSFSNPFDNSNGYNFGQLNSIIVLRGSIGNHKTFISKQSVRGISISSITNIGISLVYAKPVYLEVNKVNKVDSFSKLSIETERYNPEEHFQGNIIGKAPIFKGLFNGKFYPGAYVKYGLSFESSRQADRINALEVGAILDVYYRDIPMMANDFNDWYFFNLYVSLTFGTKK